jgi:hypothetical protein
LRAGDSVEYLRPTGRIDCCCPRPWKNATEEAADALCFAGVRVEKPAMTLCFRFLAIPMTAPRTMDSGQRRILASPAELKGIIKNILLY